MAARLSGRSFSSWRAESGFSAQRFRVEATVVERDAHGDHDDISARLRFLSLKGRDQRQIDMRLESSI